MMDQKLIKYMEQHHLLERGKTVLTGVSGGPDSMALLSFLCSIREDWNLTLIALSVDHGLRGSVSRQDVAYVKHICRKWDITFEGTSVDVASYKEEHRVGTQVAARALRYSFFKERMEKHQADYLALGHHADDQVETMLMNLARSSNPNALSGIPIKRKFASGLIIRPFLSVTREEIESYCESEGIVPRMDASNEDTTYTRNAVRKNVVPLIKELNPNVHMSLRHLSRSLQEDDSYLTAQAQKMVNNVVMFVPDKREASFEMKSFESYPSALQRRAFHLILNHLYCELPKNLSYMHEATFFNLIKNDHGNKGIDLPDRLKIVKSYQNVTFYMDNDQTTDTSYHRRLTIPGETTLPNGSRLIAETIDNPSRKGKYTYVCTCEQVTFPLHVRTRRNGDRMESKGLHGHKKLKDIFIDYKIPLVARKDWPIITDDNNQILWVIGLRKSQQKHPSSNQSFIQLTYEDKGGIL